MAFCLTTYLYSCHAYIFSFINLSYTKQVYQKKRKNLIDLNFCVYIHKCVSQCNIRVLDADYVSYLLQCIWLQFHGITAVHTLTEYCRVCVRAHACVSQTTQGVQVNCFRTLEDLVLGYQHPHKGLVTPLLYAVPRDTDTGEESSGGAATCYQNKSPNSPCCAFQGCIINDFTMFDCMFRAFTDDEKPPPVPASVNAVPSTGPPLKAAPHLFLDKLRELNTSRWLSTLNAK